MCFCNNNNNKTLSNTKFILLFFLDQFYSFDTKVRGVMPKENGFMIVKKMQVEIG